MLISRCRGKQRNGENGRCNSHCAACSFRAVALYKRIDISLPVSKLPAILYLFFCAPLVVYVKKYNFYIKVLAIVDVIVYSNTCCDIDSVEA